MRSSHPRRKRPPPRQPPRSRSSPSRRSKPQRPTERLSPSGKPRNRLAASAFRSHRKRAEQARQILGLIKRPQRLQDGVCPFLRPALADIAAELSFDVRSAHRPADKTRHIVDLADDALPIGERRRDARRYRGGTSPCGERRIFVYRDLAHEGEDARVAKLRGFVAVVV